MPQESAPDGTNAATRQPPRFYCPDLPEPKGLSDAPAPSVALPDTEARHAHQVLRLDPGDAVRLFNGRGLVATGTIDELSKRSSVVRVEAVEAASPSRPRLDVAVALPKGDRAKGLVDQLSQAGVDHLIPLVTQRGSAGLTGNKRGKLERAAIEAAKQCGRDFMLRIEPQATLDTLLQTGDAWLAMACPGAAASLTANDLSRHEHVVILVGPEGGWSTKERGAARDAGVTEVGLGPHVLRIETAAVVAAGVVRYLAQA